MSRLNKYYWLISLLFPALIFGQFPCSSGFNLNGVDDFITIPNTDAINLQNTRDRTIEFWFNTSDITTRQVIYEEGAQVNTIFFFLEGGRIYLGAYRNDAGVAADRRFFRSGTGDIEVDTWYHVAITLEDTTSPDLTLKWYLNGEEQDSQDGLQVNTHSGNISLGRNGGDLRYPSSLVTGWTASSVGGSTSETYNGTFTGSDSNDNLYTGDISLFRIWNVARTESQIDTNKATYLTSGTDLVAYLNNDFVSFIPDNGSSISGGVTISGTDKFATIPNTDAINLQDTRDRTIEFRFKSPDIDTRQILYEEGGGVNAFSIYLEGGRLYLAAYRSNGSVAADRRFFRTDIGAIEVNQWYHVALTLEDTVLPDLTLKWFLDGVEKDSQDGLQVNNHSGDISLGQNGSNLRYPNDLVSGWDASSVGGSNTETYDDALTASDSNAYNFVGDMELFRIWNVARTQSEIDTNQNTFLSSGTSLVAYQEGNTIHYQANGETSIGDEINYEGIFIWDGSNSDVWTLAANWVDDNAPASNKLEEVTIQSSPNDPVLTAETRVGRLIVDPGAEITIEDGATLNVFYGLVNNGKITIEDGGALIFHSCNEAISGSGTVEMIRDSPSYTGPFFYSYWSSPLIQTDSDPTVLFPSQPNIYKFDAISVESDWIDNAGADLIPGIGYAVRVESSGSFAPTIDGNINPGQVDVSVYFTSNTESEDPGNEWSTEGDNLVGNPFTSAIDWDIFITDEDHSMIDGTVYFWDQNTVEEGENNVSDYRQYNLTGGGSNTATGNIGSGQGFFINTTANATIKFKKTHQIVGSNNQFYRGENPRKIGRSWLSISDGKKYNSILIGFVNGATRRWDRLYDAAFNINQTSLGFYSIVQKTKKASIQGLPLLKKKKKVVKLGYVVDEVGDYSIKIDEEHIDSNYYIYLRDTEKKITTDLREKAYHFKIDSIGENNTRFKIIYTKQQRKSSREIDDEDLIISENLTAFVDATKELIIEYDFDEDNVKNVLIYDMLGKIVAKFPGNNRKNVSSLKSGIYLLDIQLIDNRRVRKKIVIR